MLKRVKCLGINLTKHIKDLDTENCKSPMSKIKETQINGKTSHVHVSQDLLLLRCQHYRFNTIPVKIPTALFAEMERPVPKLIWNCKGSRRAKTILKKKSSVGNLPLPDFKTYYEAKHNTVVLA